MEINKAIWAAGEWDVIATMVAGAGPRLLDKVPVGPGLEVLDVATGSGSSVAIPAAQRGATVIGSDLTPGHFEAGRRRAAEAGVEIEWVEADAAELPFEDGRFDRVFSTFGHMFAPDQAKAGAELIRVCKPGGMIGLATWTARGYSGQFLSVIGRHLPPPPGTRSPMLWGDPYEVGKLLPGIELSFSTDEVVMEAPTPAEFARVYEEKFGPMVMARQVIGEAAWPALRDDMRAFEQQQNTAKDGSLRVVAEYLVSVGTKPQLT